MIVVIAALPPSAAKRSLYASSPFEAAPFMGGAANEPLQFND